MTTEKQTHNEQTPQPEEYDQLDDALLAMDILCRTRCVAPTPGNNVTVTEIEENDE